MLLKLSCWKCLLICSECVPVLDAKILSLLRSLCSFRVYNIVPPATINYRQRGKPTTYQVMITVWAGNFCGKHNLFLSPVICSNAPSVRPQPLNRFAKTTQAPEFNCQHPDLNATEPHLSARFGRAKWMWPFKRNCFLSVFRIRFGGCFNVCVLL